MLILKNSSFLVIAKINAQYISIFMTAKINVAKNLDIVDIAKINVARINVAKMNGFRVPSYLQI